MRISDAPERDLWGLIVNGVEGLQRLVGRHGRDVIMAKHRRVRIVAGLCSIGTSVVLMIVERIAMGGSASEALGA